MLNYDLHIKVAIEIVHATRASRIITIRIFFNNSQGVRTFLILINNSLTSCVIYGNGQLKKNW